MGREEREQEDNGLGALFKRKQRPMRQHVVPSHDVRSVDLTTPRLERGRVPPPLPAGVIRTSPMQDDEIRGYTAQVTVTSESKVLLPADPKRKFLFVQNNDLLGNVNISFGVDATLATGMRLSANGGGILLDNNVPTSAVFIIGSIALNSNVTLVSA